MGCWSVYSQEGDAGVAGGEEEMTFEKYVAGFEWQTDGIGDLGKEAEIEIPAGFHFNSGGDAKAFLEGLGNLVGNPPNGLIGPADLDWFVVLWYEDSGHVKDDEKDELDADALFKEMKENEKYSNEMRRERGMDTLTFTGWAREPFYNDQTNNLEWGRYLEAGSGGTSVNYSTKLLGREGLMDVTLVCAPEQMDEVLPMYQDMLLGFRYKPGNTYAEFQDGDKLAEYGLTGLIVGGGAVVAGKLGLFAVLGKFFAKAWKMIVIGLIAVVAFLKKLFGGPKSGYTQQ